MLALARGSYDRPRTRRNRRIRHPRFMTDLTVSTTFGCWRLASASLVACRLAGDRRLEGKTKNLKLKEKFKIQ